MSRTNFDVASIAALLRQTESNLSALKPREDQPKPAWLAASEGMRPPAPEPYILHQPDRAQSLQTYGASGPYGGERFEVDAQIMQLRSEMQHLERRVEEDLRALLGICDKRMLAREESLRNVGEALQASANGVAEQLSQRVDTKLRDLERSANERGSKAIDEVWESLRRLQADERTLEGRVQRCALSEDFSDRLREAERQMQQRFDEKLNAHDRRALEHRTQLESSAEAWKESVNQRCHSLESRVWEQHADREDLAEAVLKKIPEIPAWRELQEELRTQVYAGEVQQRRLSACEAKVSKMPALEAKVEFAETQTAQQIEEQAQTARGLGDVAQRLSQKLAAMEATCQRVESQGAAMESRFQLQVEEEHGRVTADMEGLQDRVTQRIDDVETRLQRLSGRSERNVAQQLEAFAQRTSEDVAVVSQRLSEDLAAANQRIDVLLPQVDASCNKARQDIERMVSEFRVEITEFSRGIEEGAREVERRNSEKVERELTAFADHVNSQQFAESMWAKLENHVRSAADDVRVVTRDLRSQLVQAQHDFDRKIRSAEEVQGQSMKGLHDELRMSIEEIQGRLLEIERRVALDDSLRNLQCRVSELEAGATRIDHNFVTMRGTFSGWEELLKSRSLTWNTEAQSMKTNLAEHQSSLDRAQLNIGNLTRSVAGLENLKATVAGAQASLESLERNVRSRVQEWSNAVEASDARARTAHTQALEVKDDTQRLQTSIDSLKASLQAMEHHAWRDASVLNESMNEPSFRGGINTGELISASEERLQSRINKVSNELRNDMDSLRSQVSHIRMSVANIDTVSSGLTFASQPEEVPASLRNQIVAIQDEVESLRGDVSGLRHQSATRHAEFSNEVAFVQENVAVIKSISNDSASSVSNHSAQIANLRSVVENLNDSMTTIKRQTTVISDSPQNASRVVISQQPPGRASSDSDLSSVQSSLQAVERRVAHLESQASVRVGSFGEEPDIEDPLTLVEARLSRIEDIFQSPDIEDRALINSSATSIAALQPARWQGGTPQSDRIVVLRLMWHGDPHLPTHSRDPSEAMNRPGMVSPTYLNSALRGAVSAALVEGSFESPSLDVVHADIQTDPDTNFPRSAAYWLATSNAAVLQTVLHRQLHDPGSALRRLFPGLRIPDSSATVQDSSAGLALSRTSADQSVLQRVDHLERSFKETFQGLAENLGDVERKMLKVEKKMTLGGLPSDNMSDPHLEDLSELGGILHDASEDFEETPLPLGNISMSGPSTGRKQAVDTFDRDSEDSSRELAFVPHSPEGDPRQGPSAFQIWEADEVASNAAREQRRMRKLREEAAQAQAAAEKAAEEEAKALEEQRQFAKSQSLMECWISFVERTLLQLAADDFQKVELERAELLAQRREKAAPSPSDMEDMEEEEEEAEDQFLATTAAEHLSSAADRYAIHQPGSSEVVGAEETAEVIGGEETGHTVPTVPLPFPDENESGGLRDLGLDSTFDSSIGDSAEMPLSFGQEISPKAQEPGNLLAAAVRADTNMETFSEDREEPLLGGATQESPSNLADVVERVVEETHLSSGIDSLPNLELHTTQVGENDDDTSQVPRVQGTMTGGDDSDDDDSLDAPIASDVAGPDFQHSDENASDEGRSAPPAVSSQSRKALVGEDSSEEEEEEAVEQMPPRGAMVFSMAGEDSEDDDARSTAQVSSTSSLRMSVHQPMAPSAKAAAQSSRLSLGSTSMDVLGTSGLNRNTNVSKEEDSDDEEVERAVASSLASKPSPDHRHRLGKSLGLSVSGTSVEQARSGDSEDDEFEHALSSAPDVGGLKQSPVSSSGSTHGVMGRLARAGFEVGSTEEAACEGQQISGVQATHDQAASSSMAAPPSSPHTEATTAVGIGGSATAQAFTIAESGDNSVEQGGNSWDEEEESLGDLSNTAREALDIADNQTPTQPEIPAVVVPAQRATDPPSPASIVKGSSMASEEDDELDLDLPGN